MNEPKQNEAQQGEPKQHEPKRNERNRGEVLARMVALAGEAARGMVSRVRWLDGSRVLVAREALVEGKVKSSFQVLKRETLLPEKSAETPDALGSFQRWSSPDWRSRTVAVR